MPSYAGTQSGAGRLPRLVSRAPENMAKKKTQTKTRRVARVGSSSLVRRRKLEPRAERTWWAVIVTSKGQATEYQCEKSVDAAIGQALRMLNILGDRKIDAAAAVEEVVEKRTTVMRLDGSQPPNVPS